MGRAAVRAMRASMSASYHMLSAPEAPAPTAMAMTAMMARTGCRSPGAAKRPASDVNTTSDITRGFISSTKSPTDGSDAVTPVSDGRLCTQSRHSCPALLGDGPRVVPLLFSGRPAGAGGRIIVCGWSPAVLIVRAKGRRAERPPSAPRRSVVRAPVMRGSVSNEWNGGGEGSVHSSVVAPGPHGLLPAGTLRG